MTRSSPAAAICLLATVLAAAALTAGPTIADPLPTNVGDCANTNIKSVETRLEDGVTHQPVPDSGSAVNFDNGGYQVSYDTVKAITHSRVGDPVRMCLVSIPSPCPPGDERGRKYRTTNLRTHKSWLLPDAEHMCGGA